MSLSAFVAALKRHRVLALSAAAVAAVPLVALAVRRLLLGAPAAPPQEFALSCSCGRVRARVRARRPLHLVCHCDHCQGYVRWVAEQASTAASGGAAPQRRAAADARGGVRTVQVFKADIRLLGDEARALLQVSRLDPRLVPEGRPFALLRAHATCCGTPLFNTWRELASCSFFASAAEDDGGSGASALRRAPEWRLNTQWALDAATPLPAPAGSAQFSPLFLARFLARNILCAEWAAPPPFDLPPTEAVVVRDH